MDKRQNSLSPRTPILLLLLFCILALGWYYFGHNEADVVESQLSYIQNGHYEQAYNLMGEGYKDDHNLEQFKTLIKQHMQNPQVGSLAIYQKTEQNGGMLIRANLDLAKEGIIPIDYLLKKENNEWKIEKIDFPPISLNENGLFARASDKKTITAPGERPQDVVTKQLSALRNKNIGDAYYNIVSHEFQSQTSLNEFEKFIKDYTILINHKDVEIASASEEKGQALVKAILNPKTEPTTVEYKLTKEKDGWRIWSMRLIFPADKASNFPVFSQMAAPVLEQLKILSQKDVARAYQDYTSKPFKHTTSAEEFAAFINKFPSFFQNTKVELKDRTLQNGVGKLRIALFGLGGITQIEYTVGQEDGNWKIWGIQVISSPQSNPLFGASGNNNIASYRPFNSEELLKVIEGQLDALKNHDIPKAYYSFTSAQFQEATPLADFEKFVESTPILTHRQAQSFSKLIFNNNIASFSGNLTDDGIQYPVEYDLLEEEGKWKILQILVFPALNEASSSPSNQSEEKQQNKQDRLQ
jgi:hypothetical protein